MRRSLSRQKIIEKTSVLFVQQGYQRTTMSDIARVCQVKKATLYHHIPSRKIVVLEVLEQAISMCKMDHLSVVYQEEITPLERLVKLLTLSNHFFIARKGRCLIHILWYEAAEEIPEVMTLVKDYFTAWVDALTFLLRTQYSETQSKKLAENAVAQLQGAILYGSLFQNYQPLKSISEQLIGLLTAS